MILVDAVTLKSCDHISCAQECLITASFQGYSSLAIALALPKTGHLVACERDAKCLEVANKYYEKAGVSHKVILLCMSPHV